MRPMKDMIAKEIGIYNQFQGLETLNTRTLTSKMRANVSIDRLTEDFIVGLEKDYPSTVSTIARTASKLSLSGSIDPERRCVLCNMPYQAGIREWQNRITVRLTPQSAQSLSSFDLKSPPTSSPCLSHEGPLAKKSCSVNDCCSSKTVGPSQQDPIGEISESLCYGCLVNMRDVTKVELPPYVAETFEKQRIRQNMKKQIQEFLLDDGEDDNG